MHRIVFGKDLQQFTCRNYGQMQADLFFNVNQDTMSVILLLFPPSPKTKWIEQFCSINVQLTNFQTQKTDTHLYLSLSIFLFFCCQKLNSFDYFLHSIWKGCYWKMTLESYPASEVRISHFPLAHRIH